MGINHQNFPHSPLHAGKRPPLPVYVNMFVIVWKRFSKKLVLRNWRQLQMFVIKQFWNNLKTKTIHHFCVTALSLQIKKFCWVLSQTSNWRKANNQICQQKTEYEICQQKAEYVRNALFCCWRSTFLFKCPEDTDC